MCSIACHYQGSYKLFLNTRRNKTQLTSIKLLTQTRMHSSRMRTVSSSSHPGGVSTRHPPEQTPLGTAPPDQAPPGSRPPIPQTRLPPDQAPPRSTPPDQAPPQEHTPQTRHPPVDRITDACENITLPQLRCRR